MPTVPFSTDDLVTGGLIELREFIEANIQSLQEQMQALERRLYILLAYVLLFLILVGFGIYYMYTRKYEFSE